MTTDPDDGRAPTFRQFLREFGVVGEWLRGRATRGRIVAGHDGGGRAVMVIPGFLAHDMLTRPLRQTLAAAGYRVEGWGLGQNRGVIVDLLDRLDGRIERMAAAHGPVTLIGWSLGGLYAREAAKHRPDRVAAVVTLGSPFSGDPRANRAWRLYERINRHPVDRPPIEAVLADKPPVPTVALWSPRDGIVAPGATRGLAGEADRTVRVECTHTGFVRAPAALRAILQVLREEGARRG